MGLKNLRKKNHSIDFNVVNPSNNTFNRQKNIITIFVNETKYIFEKNLKEKTTPKLTPKMTQKVTPDSTAKVTPDSTAKVTPDSTPK